jgi:hypothetical protein
LLPLRALAWLAGNVGRAPAWEPVELAPGVPGIPFRQCRSTADSESNDARMRVSARARCGIAVQSVFL